MAVPLEVESYTYADFLEWDENFRAELLDGEIVMMAPPSSEKYDRIAKFRKYQSAGVREYWIVDPELQSVQVCTLENGRYITSMYDENEKVPIDVLSNCIINLPTIFAD